MNFDQILEILIKEIDLKVFDENFRKEKVKVDEELLNYLELGRRCLETNEQVERGRIGLKIVVEYSWEKLNTGIWQNVAPIYRYLYAYSCYMDVLIDCRLKSGNVCSSINKIVEKCDLGILLGGPILEKKFNDLISLINEHFQEEKTEIDEHLPTKKKVKRDEPFQWMPMPILDPNKSIERIECPSLEYFYNEVMKKKRAVLLTRCIDHWPALKKWSFEYLIQIAGDRTVPIELGSRYSDDDWTQKLMKMRDFVEEHCLHRSLRCGYLAQHPLLDQIPDLRKDIAIPDYCYLTSEENDQEQEDVDVNAWIGPKQTISPLHNDPKQNLLAQVVGEKYIRLYDPIHSSKLHALGSSMLSNTSSIDVEHPDYDRFPDFRDIPFVEFILKPGEMLYMPARHWHYVRSLSPSFSVNFWWN